MGLGIDAERCQQPELPSPVSRGYSNSSCWRISREKGEGGGWGGGPAAGVRDDCTGLLWVSLRVGRRYLPAGTNASTRLENPGAICW